MKRLDVLSLFKYRALDIKTTLKNEHNDSRTSQLNLDPVLLEIQQSTQKPPKDYYKKFQKKLTRIEIILMNNSQISIKMHHL